MLTITLPNSKPIPTEKIPRLIAEAIHLDDKPIHQAATDLEHKKLLQNAVMNGELMVYSTLTRAPIPFASGGELDRSIIKFQDFCIYAQQFDIQVQAEDDLALDKINNEQELMKKKAGRYTLEEAANMISEATGENTDLLTQKLIKSAEEQTLSVHMPGKKSKHLTETTRSFYEEAYWDDLNIWLETHEQRITWRFPEPTTIEKNNNRPSSEHPFINPPANYNYWFNLIDSMMIEFESKNRRYPSREEAWDYLYGKSEKLGVKGMKENHISVLKAVDGKLKKNNFLKRWNRYTLNKK